MGERSSPVCFLLSIMLIFLCVGAICGRPLNITMDFYATL